MYVAAWIKQKVYISSFILIYASEYWTLDIQHESWTSYCKIYKTTTTTTTTAAISTTILKCFSSTSTLREIVAERMNVWIFA